MTISGRPNFLTTADQSLVGVSSSNSGVDKPLLIQICLVAILSIAKAEAKMAKKSITELTATKRKSKVAEIDAVIDGLRKTNATVSPFAALGV